MKIRFFILLFLLAGCVSTKPGDKTVPFHIGDTADPQYQKIWTASNTVTGHYFKIQKADRKKGVIVTEPRVEKDASGVESKRGFVTILQAASGYDVKVEIPYLKYNKLQNEYTESMKGDKHLLVVERKPVSPPTKNDIYLESLIRTEILKQASQT